MKRASRQLRATGAVETRSTLPPRFWAMDGESIARDAVALSGEQGLSYFAELAMDLDHQVVRNAGGELETTRPGAAGVETNSIAVVASSSDPGGAALLATTARILATPTVPLQRDIQFVLLSDRAADRPSAWSTCIGVATEENSDPTGIGVADNLRGKTDLEIEFRGATALSAGAELTLLVEEVARADRFGQFTLSFGDFRTSREDGAGVLQITVRGSDGRRQHEVCVDIARAAESIGLRRSCQVEVNVAGVDAPHTFATWIRSAIVDTAERHQVPCRVTAADGSDAMRPIATVSSALVTVSRKPGHIDEIADAARLVGSSLLALDAHLAARPAGGTVHCAAS